MCLNLNLNLNFSDRKKYKKIIFEETFSTSLPKKTFEEKSLPFFGEKSVTKQISEETSTKESLKNNVCKKKTKKNR